MVYEASASLAIRLGNLRAVIVTLVLVLLTFGGSGCRKDDTPADTDDKKHTMPTTRPVNPEKTNELRTHSESLKGMDIDKVRELIAVGADVNVRNKYNATPLHMAVGTKQTEIVKLLLAAKADVNAAPRSGMTPLTIVAGNGGVKIVKLLLAAGADVDLPPGEFPCSQLNIPFAPKLPKRYRDTPLYGMHLAPLWVASASGHLEVVKLLLDAGADVYVTDINGVGAAFMAGMCGHGDVAKLLLAHGGDADYAHGPSWSRPSLFRAIMRDNLEGLKQLLTEKADINAVGRYGTHLVCALLCRRPEMAKLLRAAGADLKVSDTFSMAAAAKYGREDIVKLMLEAKSTPNPIRLGARPSPLYAACTHGHIGVVRLLLNAGADVNATVLRGEEEWTPMSIAKARGHTAIAELLKTHGGKASSTPTTKLVNAENSNELRTHSESLKGMDIDKVRELIAAGANVNVRNKYDATPLYMAVGTMQAEVVNFLLTAKADVNAAPRLGLTPLVVAVGNGDVKTVKLLLAAGADVELPLGEFPTSRYKLPFVPNKPTPSSNVRVHLAPLWVATIYGHTEIVKMLLDSGANVNVADRDRISAIHIATGYNRRDIVKMLLAHHADPNMVSPAYYTPLSHAVSNNNIEIVKLLLAAKADPNAYGSRGTPLFCALMDSRPGIAKVLRAAGADLSKPAPSSLRRAAGSGREDVVKLMLKAKVTPNPIRRGGIDSPLHAACRGGHISMVRLLLKAGADVNAIVNSMKGNMTPMSIAKSNGSTAIAELLQKHGGKE